MSKYYDRGTEPIEGGIHEELERMRDELDESFAGVETDTDANTAAAAAADGKADTAQAAADAAQAAADAAQAAADAAQASADEALANRNNIEMVCAYYFGPDVPGPVPLIGDSPGAGTGMPIKEKCYLEQIDVTFRTPPAAPGTAISLENLTKATGGPLPPFAAGVLHQHVTGLGLLFDPNDQLAVTHIGGGDAAMSDYNVVLIFHKEPVT